MSQYTGIILKDVELGLTSADDLQRLKEAAEELGETNNEYHESVCEALEVLDQQWLNLPEWDEATWGTERLPDDQPF